MVVLQRHLRPVVLGSILVQLRAGLLHLLPRSRGHRLPRVVSRGVVFIFLLVLVVPPLGLLLVYGTTRSEPDHRDPGRRSGARPRTPSRAPQPCLRTPRRARPTPAPRTPTGAPAGKLTALCPVPLAHGTQMGRGPPGLLPGHFRPTRKFSAPTQEVPPLDRVPRQRAVTQGCFLPSFAAAKAPWASGRRLSAALAALRTTRTLGPGRPPPRSMEAACKRRC